MTAQRLRTLRSWSLIAPAVAVLALLAAGGPGRAAAPAGPPVPRVPSDSPTALGYSARGADTCLICHRTNARVMGIFRSPHAQPDNPASPFGPGGLQCEACHGPGGAHVKAFGMKPAGIVVFGPHSPTPAARQNAMCLACHKNVQHAWLTGAHAANDVTCADCHQIHGATDPVRMRATEATVCAKCHAGVVARFREPFHHPVPEGTMTCSSCHDPHGSLGADMLVKSTVNATCTACHAEMRGPFLWPHQPVSDDCLNCHAPHGSVVPALLREPTPILCQQCHDLAGHPSVPYGPQGLPAGTPNPYLLIGGCVNCHSRIHGSNSPSGQALMR